MKVKVKLFAMLRNHIRDNKSGLCMLELNSGACIKDVVEMMKLPENMPKIFLINGVQKGVDDVLADGDTLSVFPPVAGG